VDVLLDRALGVIVRGLADKTKVDPE
jgi:hypothetical protein